MKLTFVEKLPERRNHHDVQRLIKEFADSDCEFAKIEIHENDYPDLYHAYKSIHRSVQVSKRMVKLVKCGDELYFVRKR